MNIKHSKSAKELTEQPTLRSASKCESISQSEKQQVDEAINPLVALYDTNPSV